MAKKKQYTGSPSASDVTNWSAQIVPKDTVVSGQASVQPSATATPGVGFEVGPNIYAKTLYNMSLQERKIIAQSLKNAGYKVNTNGVYYSGLVSAYTDAVTRAQLDAQQLGQTFNDSFFTNYLSRETAARSSVGAGTGRDGTYTTEVESVITKANAEDIINKVFKGELRRAATDEEIARYTREFKEKAAAKPTVTTTITSGKKTKVKTQPGFTTGRAEQYLVDRIAGTDEAKANQVLSYYESAMKVLAGE